MRSVVNIVAMHLRRVGVAFLVLPLALPFVVGCGMFAFSPVSPQFATVRGAFQLEASDPEAAPLDCIQVQGSQVLETGTPLINSGDTRVTLTFDRATDRVYQDPNCTLPAESTLSIPKGSSSVSFFVRATDLGSLKITAQTPQLSGTLRVEIKNLPRMLTFSSPHSFTAGLGYCNGPLYLELRDNSGSPVISPDFQIALDGNKETVYLDSLCSQPLGNRTIQIQNSDKQALYIKGGASTPPFGSLRASAPGNSKVPPDDVDIQFSLVPYRIRIQGGPASNSLPLSICETTPFQIDVVDFNGNPIPPLPGQNIAVALSNLGTNLLVTPNCLAGTSPLTEVTLTSGSPLSTIYLKASQRGVVTLSGSSSQVAQGASKNLSVIAVPYAFSLQGPPSVTAGAIQGPYTLTLLDGLGAPVAAMSSVIAQLTMVGAAGGSQFCVDANCVGPISSLSFATGQSNKTFYFQPNSSSETTTVSLQASATGLFSGSLGVSVNRRQPAKLRISGGPPGNLLLNQCSTDAFSVDLLDNMDVPVTVATGQSVVVTLSFSSGSGTFHTSCALGGTPTLSLTFTAGNGSKPFFVKPTSRGSVTVRAQASGLTESSITKNVTADPTALSLSGPSSLRCGTVSTVFTATLQDALGAATAAPSAIASTISLTDSARATFCADAQCSNRLISGALTFPAGSSSQTFYVLCDADADIPNTPVQISASGLSSGSRSVLVDRTATQVDPALQNFSGSTTVISNYSGGEALSGLFSNSRYQTAGYLKQSGLKKTVVLSFLWNPLSPSTLGSLDSAFGNGGALVLTLPENHWAAGTTIQGANTIVGGVLQASPTEGGDYDIVLLRLNATSLDSTYRHVAGLPDPYRLPGDQFVTSVTTASDGSTYVAGYATPEVATPTDTSDAFLAVFSASGQPLTFQRYDIGTLTDVIYASALQRVSGEDRIILAGCNDTGATSNLEFFRLHGVGNQGKVAGDLDVSFGSAGKMTLDLGASGGECARGIALQSSGIVFGAGRTLSSSTDIVFGRLALGNGQLDTSFGNAGTRVVDVPSRIEDRLNAVIVESRTQEIYGAGSTEAGFLLINLSSTGSSPTLSQFGTGSDAARTIGLEPSTQKPVLAGQNAGNFRWMRFLR